VKALELVQRAHRRSSGRTSRRHWPSADILPWGRPTACKHEPRLVALPALLAASARPRSRSSCGSVTRGFPGGFRAARGRMVIRPGITLLLHGPHDPASEFFRASLAPELALSAFPPRSPWLGRSFRPGRGRRRAAAALRRVEYLRETRSASDEPRPRLLLRARRPAPRSPCQCAYELCASARTAPGLVRRGQSTWLWTSGKVASPATSQIAYVRPGAGPTTTDTPGKGGAQLRRREGHVALGDPGASSRTWRTGPFPRTSGLEGRAWISDLRRSRARTTCRPATVGARTSASRAGRPAMGAESTFRHPADVRRRSAL
jgi:hypothetical protein